MECWQYGKRKSNIKSDLDNAIKHFYFPKDLFTQSLEISENDLFNLRIRDFSLSEESKFSFNETKQFIKKHEWLGTMSPHPTHIFTARYMDLLCGVVIMDMPNAFSKMLGEKTRKLERLISRGACISFSPKNLASALIMFSIRWMVQNTSYRLFTSYADPLAAELGTIYQACNFFYLGNKFGAGFQYKIENGKWVSDRYFRRRSVYKRLAKSNGIEWNPKWQNFEVVLFSGMPEELEKKIKRLSKEYMESCERREVASKHKYAYVLGKTKTETKYLRKEFLSNNKTYPYPKERGL